MRLDLWRAANGDYFLKSVTLMSVTLRFELWLSTVPENLGVKTPVLEKFTSFLALALLVFS